MFAVKFAASFFNINAHVNDYNKNLEERFRKKKDNSYHMELPWHYDNIDLVPSNEYITFRVLCRNLCSLERREMDKAYNDVFARTSQKES